MREATNAVRRFSEATLRLFALVKDAEELAAMASPSAPRVTNATGITDPTATAVLDPKREAVAAALRDAERLAEALTERVETAREHIARAVSDWQS